MNGPLNKEQTEQARKIWIEKYPFSFEKIKKMVENSKEPSAMDKFCNYLMDRSHERNSPLISPPLVNKGNFRMYHFVMYNLSGIQKGIQSYHVGIEYSRKFPNSKDFAQWADVDKTVIILDGGGSIDMEEREKELESFKIPFASFLEPDLNDSISSIAFLVPESVYNFDEESYRYFKGFGDLDSPEYKFYKYLKSFKLAAN